MTAPKFIDIDGKRHLWRDIVKLRQEQLRAAAEAAPVQPPLVRIARRFSPDHRTQRRHPLSRTIAVFPEPEESRAGRFSLVFPSRFFSQQELSHDHSDTSPLSKLVPSPDNVRKTDRLSGIERFCQPVRQLLVIVGRDGYARALCEGMSGDALPRMPIDSRQGTA